MAHGAPKSSLAWRHCGGVVAAMTLAVLSAACRIESGAPAASATDTIPGIETQIARMMERSADAWNRGDLDGFMSDYFRSPTTTYIGSSGSASGWEAIRARFAPRFQAGALRDSLRYEAVAGRPLGTDHALATARYVLFRDGRVSETGPFTLVLRRTDEGWKILHDQSAADPPAVEDAGETQGGEEAPDGERTPAVEGTPAGRPDGSSG